MQKLLYTILILVISISLNSCGDSSTEAENNSVKLDMVYVEGGSFEMTDEYANNKKIQRSVSSFYIDKFEMTQESYAKVMNSNPSRFQGDKLPVESISWYDAIEFCNNLSEMQGLEKCYLIKKELKDIDNHNDADKKQWVVICDFDKNGYRLPTETEWEFAARGGNTSKDYDYSGSNDVLEVGWYKLNTTKTKSVGRKKANELGIYDMSGNVTEYCWDWYNTRYASSPDKDNKGPKSGVSRSQRGGSWNDEVDFLRSKRRFYYNSPSKGYSFLGFRVVRSKVD
jgi:formylglycine-generating enzyme required for sulfatase activity